MNHIVWDWAINDGEGGFICYDGRHVELHRTRKDAREFLKRVKDLFPKAYVCRVRTVTFEMYK